MAVFFSGTDNDELKENSAFHNYYVSLIVNNRNDMCAKVAFRATEVRDTKSVVSYRGTDGSLKSKEVTGQTTEESVYAYNCVIEKPDSVGESFADRFHQIREEKEEEKKKLAAKAKEVTNNLDPYKGFDGKAAYDQIGLYEDVRPESSRGKGGKGEKRLEKGVITLPPDYVDRQWSGSVKGGNKKKDLEIDSRRVYEFLVKLLRRDFIAVGSLGKVMEDLNADLYKSGVDDGSVELYMDSLDDLAISYYVSEFPEDFHTLHFNKVLSAAVLLVEMYESQYPELVSDLVQALNFAMDE